MAFVPLLSVLRGPYIVPMLNDFENYKVEYHGDDDTKELLERVFSHFTIEEFRADQNRLHCISSDGLEFVIGEYELVRMSALHLRVYGLIAPEDWTKQ